VLCDVLVWNNRPQHRTKIWIKIYHIYPLHTSRHSLQIILISNIFIIIHILFHYSTMNFKQKL